METKLEQILAKKLEEIIEIWTKEFTSFGSVEEAILVKEASVHKIKLRDQMMYLEPSIHQAREFWNNQLHHSIAIVWSAKRLENRLEANFYLDNSPKETIIKVF